MMEHTIATRRGRGRTASVAEARHHVQLMAGSLVGGNDYEDLLVAVDALVAAVRSGHAIERERLLERAETAEHNFMVAHVARVEAEQLLG